MSGIVHCKPCHQVQVAFPVTVGQVAVLGMHNVQGKWMWAGLAEVFQKGLAKIRHCTAKKQGMPNVGAAVQEGELLGSMFRSLGPLAFRSLDPVLQSAQHFAVEIPFRPL